MKMKIRELTDDGERGRDALGVVRALTGPYVGMGRRSKRRRRIKELSARPSTCFHLMPRICDGLPLFDETDKEALVIVLRKLARFCDISVFMRAVKLRFYPSLRSRPAEWLC